MSNESAYLIIESPTGKHDIKAIKKELDTLHGVTSVSISPENHLVAIDYDSSGTSYDKIENCINKMGYEIAADASNIQSR